MNKEERAKALAFEWDQKTITPQACDYVTAVFDEILDSIPKAKKMDVLGAANDVFLFIAAVKKAGS